MSKHPLRGELGLPPLPDYIRPGLRILFIGFNPGERAAQIGHYYGYPGNRFWWLLYEAGLTDRLLRPEEDQSLLDYGLGLTDIVARPSKSSSDLSGWELREGREALLQKLHTYRPKIACCNGLGVYRALTGRKSVAYGRQPVSVAAGIIDFVAASPSGRSRAPLAHKLALYQELRHLSERV
jgi:TDG/mug DNA glycosylase family protein